MQFVRVQHPVTKAADSSRKLQMVARSETLLVLAGIVFPPEKALVVKRWSVRNPISIRERAQSVAAIFTCSLKRLPDVKMISMPDWDANGALATLKLQECTRANAK